VVEGRANGYKGDGVRGSSGPRKGGRTPVICMASYDIAMVNLHNGCHLVYASKTNSVVSKCFNVLVIVGWGILVDYKLRAKFF
jgi:hypothetical protein